MRSRAVMFVLGVACAAAAFATGGGGWVADTWGSYVYKVSPNGSIVRSYGPYVYPYGIGVDEGDNAVLFTVNASEVVKVAFAGGEVWRRTYSSEQISVNAADGGCWVRVYNPRAAARLDRPRLERLPCRHRHRRIAGSPARPGGRLAPGSGSL